LLTVGIHESGAEWSRFGATERGARILSEARLHSVVVRTMLWL